MATLKITANEKNFIAGLSAASGSVGQLAGVINVKLANSFKAADFYTKNFEKGLGRLGNSFKEAGETMSVGLTLPLVFLGKAASDAYAEFDALRRALGTVEPTATGLASRLKELREIAKMPGIGFQEAIQGDVRLRSVGISAEASAKILREFANAVAMTGGGKAQLNEITVQLGQMAAKGKVLAQDLRPIIEAAPAVAMALKNMFGTVSSEAISEQLEKTGKSSTDMINMLLIEMEKAPRVTGGWKNSLENLGDTLFVAKAEMFEVADNLFNLQEKMEGVAKTVEKFVQGFKELPEPVQKAILGITALAALLGPLSYGIGLVITSMSSLVTAAGLTAAAVGALVIIIGSLGIAYASVASTSKDIEDATRSLSDTYKIAESSIATEIGSLQKNVEVLRSATSTTDEVRAAKEELLKLNPDFKDAIKGDIINFSTLNDVVSKTADELLRVAKYQSLIKQKETAVKSLDEMQQGRLNGLTGKQLFAGALILGAGSEKDVFQEQKEENEKQIREQILFIDKTLDKYYADLVDKNKERVVPPPSSPPPNPFGSGAANKAADKAGEKAWRTEEKWRGMLRDGREKWLEHQEKQIELQKKSNEKYNDLLSGAISPPKSPTKGAWGKADPKVIAGMKDTFTGLSKEMYDAQRETADATEKGLTDYEIMLKEFPSRMEGIRRDFQNIGIDLMSDMVSGLMSGDGLQGALKSALTAFGNYAIQLGKHILPIAKILELLKIQPNTANAIALIAGGTLLKGVASKISVPRFAEGGVVNSPTLAMIGDNRSGKEMALPFEKTGEFADMISARMSGGIGGGDIVARIKGSDLLLIQKRAERAK